MDGSVIQASEKPAQDRTLLWLLSRSILSNRLVLKRPVKVSEFVETADSTSLPVGKNPGACLAG
jgi:hypothetical protein